MLSILNLPCFVFPPKGALLRKQECILIIYVLITGEGFVRSFERRVTIVFPNLLNFQILAIFINYRSPTATNARHMMLCL